jgi:hypothetical protein
VYDCREEFQERSALTNPADDAGRAPDTLAMARTNDWRTTWRKKLTGHLNLPLPVFCCTERMSLGPSLAQGKNGHVKAA